MRGLAMMALGFFTFAAVDTQAKFLTATLHPIQITWTRQFGLLLVVLVLLAVKGPAMLRTAHPVLQVVRGALAAMSGTLFIVGISFVPLVDAMAVTFIAPFIVTLMGALVLREKVGIRRWIAVAIGFAGTLVVIRPGMGVVHPAVVLVLLAAVCFAMRQVISRALASSDSTLTTVAYTALVGGLLLSLPLPFVWEWPQDRTSWMLMGGIAVLAGLGELMVIKALQIGEATVLSPMQYSLLIWGTFYGWLVFGELPDLWTYVGALIIGATGIYTLQRERLAARRAAAET